MGFTNTRQKFLSEGISEPWKLSSNHFDNNKHVVLSVFQYLHVHFKTDSKTSQNLK